jgi:hypothetical protein
MPCYISTALYLWVSGYLFVAIQIHYFIQQEEEWVFPLGTCLLALSVAQYVVVETTYL